MERDMLFRELAHINSYNFIPQFEWNNEVAVAHTEEGGFYSQMNNANILHGEGHHARGRTCNITTIAMVLESLGKTNADTINVNRESLVKLNDFFKKELNNKPLAALRFPDFMQLLAIYRKLSDKNLTNANNDAAIKSARAEAAANITLWSFMDELTESFKGIKFESKSIFSSSINGGLKKIGKKYRLVVKGHAVMDDKEVDAIIPASTYKAEVLATMKAELSKGHRVIIHEYNHFTVLLDLNNDKVIINNPGKTNGGNMHVSWADARKRGMFSGYMAVSSNTSMPSIVYSNSNSAATNSTTSTSSFSSPLVEAVAYNNRNYSNWRTDEYAIYTFLGRTDSTPSPETFAQMLMNWQRQNSLTPDGKLGAITLAKLKQAMQLKDTSSASSSTNSSTNAPSEKTKKSIGWKNNNPGNLKGGNINWNGKTGENQGFVTFQSFAYGLRAMIKLIINYINTKKLKTVKDIISLYAPPFENKTTEYINFVSDNNPNWQPNPSSKEDMYHLISKMVKMEIGYTITQSQFDEAWRRL